MEQPEKINVSANCCRICFEQENDQNVLISPCKCSGTIKHVHEECLKIWITSQNRDINNSKCDICKSEFLMQVEVKKICTCSRLREECFKILLYSLMIVLIGSVLAIVVFYLIVGVVNNQLGVDEKVYFSIIIFFCATILLTLFVIFVKTLIMCFFETKMIKWSICSVKELNETLEVSHHTELSNNEELLPEKPDVKKSVIVVPSSTMYNGNKVVPVFSSLTLNLVNRDNSGNSYYSRRPSLRSANDNDRQDEVKRSQEYDCFSFRDPNK